MEMETERLAGTDKERIVWGLQISIQPELQQRMARHLVGFVLSWVRGGGWMDGGGNE